MALTLPSLPTLPHLSPVVRDDRARRTAPSASLARCHAVATAPTTALVVMLLGLALLFALPLIGLPFVALVVLPAVIYHLRAEGRSRRRRPGRR